MENEQKIVTLFEFTQKGYEETEERLRNLLTLQNQVAASQQEAAKIYEENKKELDQLNKSYAQFNKILEKSSTKEAREEFEATKAKIIELQAATVTYSQKVSELNKQQEAAAKKVKETEEAYNTYKAVMAELSKGMDNAKTSMNNLAAAQSYLKKELNNTELGSDKYKQLSQELAQVTNTMNSVRKSQQQQAKESNVEAGSVEALRLKVSALKNEWKSLNQNSPQFAKVRDELKATTDELNKAEQAVGIFGRNVGNYSSAFDGLKGGMVSLVPSLGGVVGGFKAMTSAAMAFIATPIGMVIGAIVAAVAALKAAFTSSAEGQEKYNKLMGVLSGIFTVLKDTVADFGEYLISIFTEPEKAYQKFKKYVLNPLTFQFKALYNGAMGVGYAIAGIFSEEAREKSKQYFQNIKDDFNEIKQAAVDLWDGIKEKVQEVNQKAQEGLDIAEMENALIRQRLNTTKELAANEAKISELRSKAAQRNKKDADEQARALAQLQEAQKLIERNAQIRVDLARREYEIQKAKNALGKSTQEDLQKEADLQAEMLRVQKAATDQQRKIATQIVEISASQKEAYKTLLTERIAAEQTIATQVATIRDLVNKQAEASEIEAAKKTLDAYRSNLEAKTALLQKYTDNGIQLDQKAQDEIELAEVLGSKAIEAIRRKSNDAAISTYNDLVAGVRDAQAKIIAAQKAGNLQQTELYQELLNARQAKLEAFDRSQLEYTEEQRQAKEVADEAYRVQQEQAYIAERQKLYELQVQADITEDQHEKQKIQAQIAQQAAAVDTIGQLVAAGGTDIEALWDREKTFIDAGTEYTTAKLMSALDQLDSFSEGAAGTFAKASKAIIKDISKIVDLDKLFKDGRLSLEDFKREAIMVALSIASSGVDATKELLTEGLEAQKKSIEDLAAFQIEQAQRSYDRRKSELDKSLAAGEISEARYRIEQIKAEDEQAEKERDIERNKANQMYAIEMKQFRVEKATDLAKAGINIALGITSVLSMGLVGIALASLIGALGAVQTAAIMKRQPPEKPKYAEGGILPFVNIQGPSHRDGGVPVSIGGNKVAEVEGGEGALIISKKAMKDDRMRAMLALINGLNEDISGTNDSLAKFEEGGYLTYDDFFQKAYASLKVKRKRRKLWVNGKKYKLPNRGRGVKQQEIMNDVAEEIATKEFEEYRTKELQKLESREQQLTAEQNKRISGNSIMSGLGVSDYAGYTQMTEEKEQRQKDLQDQISAYKTLAEVRENDLKDRLDYDNKIKEFEARSVEIDKELETSTLEFNRGILDQMLQAGEISADEHASYIDQITKGYGASTSDIINLKKKQVEAVKALIEEERNAELKAAQEVADFRTEALDQIRTEWEESYNETTEAILDDLSDANAALVQLSGEDLRRFEEMVKMSEKVKEIDEAKLKLNEEYNKLGEKYAANELELNDGIIHSREEQLALQEEQKRIQEEQKRIQEEIQANEAERDAQTDAIDEAKEAFEQGRADAMEQARQAYEKENFDTILAQVKELGAVLQENEANNWTLEKALAAELDTQLGAINQTYDAQIQAQDAIIDGYNEQLNQLQLIHDRKTADLNAEQALFEDNFNRQKALIDEAYNNAVSGLNAELQDINGILANLKIAGIQTGVASYQEAISNLTDQINTLPSKYATGGVIEMGEGVYTAAGPSHLNGGIPVSIGGTKIAEIEGGEKLFTVNKFASADPKVKDALSQISQINESYTGMPLGSELQSSPSLEIDYQTLAYYIGREINSRPVQTYISEGEIALAGKVQAAKRAVQSMK